MANHSSSVLDASFGALSHPSRRHVVEVLTQGPLTIGDATHDLGIAKPTVTRHLRVLENAGLVERTINGREHLVSLVRGRLAAPARWLEVQALWERKMDAVEDFLREGGDHA